MTNDDISPDHVDPLLQLIHGGWTSQVICTAAELGLAELLSAGEQTLQQLAKSAKCNPQALDRLLRALTSLGIVTVGNDGEYAMTPLGSRLRADAPDSLNAQAQWFGLHSWSLWGDLTESVRTGVSARQRRSGLEGYVDFESTPQAAQLFNRAMCELTRVVALALVSKYDFHQAARIIDIGGGHGELLIPILLANPQAHGVLVDLEHAIEGARRHLAGAGLGNRTESIEGDFFVGVPDDGDIYLLKAVLHNWDDDRCAMILATLRRNMPANSRLLVIERVSPDKIDGSALQQAALRSDLNMLVGRGGRERSRAEFTAMLEQSGFTTTRVISLAEGFSVIEAV